MSLDQPAIFISYSHKDERWKDRLVQHLRVLGGERAFDVWDDQRIAAGDAWKEQIERAIATASVAVLLVSVDFLDSRFIRGEEVPKLLRRREAEKLPIVPVIVRPCAWKDIAWLGGSLQVLPKGGKPLSGRSEYALEKSLTSIAREIGALVPRGPRPSAPDAGAAAPGVSGSQHPTTPQPPTSPTRTPEPRPRPAWQTPPGAVLSPDVPPAGAIAASTPITFNYYASTPTGGSPAGAIAASTPVTPNPSEPEPAPALTASPGPAPVEPNAARRVVSRQRPRPGEPPPPRTARWRVPALAIVGALVMLGAFYAGYRWFEKHPAPGPSATSSTQPAVAGAEPPLHPFEFETVTVDARGVEGERRKLRGQSFIEDLGDGVTLEMVAISGGTFAMGSPASETGSGSDERPQHTVTVAPFSIGKFEVTQAQWRAIALLPRVTWDLGVDPAFFKGAQRPVEQVTWRDAAEFCARLSRKTSRTYRLPSEAEWEFAARAGTSTPFAFGPTITPALVNYDGNNPYGNAAKGEFRARTTDVGSLGVANAFGLFDMHGNVWEWTEDVWHDSYEGAPNDGLAWEEGGNQASRVLRGGAWNYYAWNCRSAVRDRDWPGNRNYLSFGFRVVCAVSRTP